MIGASAILFVHIQEEEDMDRTLARLNKLISNVFKKPPIPLHILTTSKSVKKDDFLAMLDDKKSVSNVQLSRIPCDFFSSRLILSMTGAITSLAAQAPFPRIPGDFKVRSLQDFIEDFLCSYIFSEFYSNLKDRLAKNLPHQQPNSLIALYNAGLDHLKKVCLSKSLEEVSLPIPELQNDLLNLPSYWNDPMYLDLVVEILNSIRLPEMREKVDQIETTFADQVEQTRGYFETIRKHSDIDSSRYSNRIRQILMKSCRAFKRQMFLFDDHAFPFVPWTDVIRTCIDYKIAHMSTNDRFSTKNQQMIIGFFQFELESFEPPKIWKLSVGYKMESDFQSRMEESVREKQDLEKSKNVLDSTLEMTSEELEASMRFEERLKQASQNSAKLSEERKEISTVYGTVREYLPSVSFLSPSLSKLTSPLCSKVSYKVSRALWKDESSGQKETLRQNWTLKRRLSSNEEDSLSKRRLEGSLQSRIQEDLDASYQFERRLHDALNK